MDDRRTPACGVFASVLLPLLVLGTCPLARAQVVTPGRQQACAQGILRKADGSNDHITLCGAILQADPNLAEKLDQVTRLLSGKQDPIQRLTRSVNAVGSNLDLSRQIRLLQTLVDRLSSNPETATTRAEHLATALDSVEAQITTVRRDPLKVAILQGKLDASLGDSLAQLDTAEAAAELNDIRAEVHRIDETTTRTDETTSRTEKQVAKLNRTVERTLHPERSLPAEEGQLYQQMSPLLMDLSFFMNRWRAADVKKLTKIVAKPSAAPTLVTGYEQSVREMQAPLLDEYKTQLPRLNGWRLRLAARVPALSDSVPFEPVTNITGMNQGEQRVRLLIQNYIATDPQPSPELAREGHELQAKLTNLSVRMHDVYAVARKAPFSIAVVPPPSPVNSLQSQTELYDETTDGPLVKEFLADLEPRLRRWQNGATKYDAAFKPTDFAEVRTSHDLRELETVFNREVMRFYQKVAAQISADPETAP